MTLLTTIINQLTQHASIEVAWLYGSRATNQANQNSDYDLAVAYKTHATESIPPIEKIDDLHYELNKNSMTPISVVDINRIPAPLAHNVITDGNVILCQSDFRLRLEQQRIWSLWEEYKYQHEYNRKKL